MRQLAANRRRLLQEVVFFRENALEENVLEDETDESEFEDIETPSTIKNEHVVDEEI